MNNNLINFMNYGGPQLANVASVFPKFSVFLKGKRTKQHKVLKLVHMFEGLIEFAVLFEIIGSKQRRLEFCAKRPWSLSLMSYSLVSHQPSLFLGLWSIRSTLTIWWTRALWCSWSPDGSVRPNRSWPHSSTSGCAHQTSSSLYVDEPLVFIWDI